MVEYVLRYKPYLGSSGGELQYLGGEPPSTFVVYNLFKN